MTLEQLFYDMLENHLKNAGVLSIDEFITKAEFQTQLELIEETESQYLVITCLSGEVYSYPWSAPVGRNTTSG